MPSGPAYQIAAADGAGSKESAMNEQEAKKELAQAKEELLKAKTKLKALNDKLMELSDVMEKIEAAQGRLQKVEENLFLNNFSKKSFFLQYKYPRFYIGTYFELPNNSPFYKNPIRAELAFGINLSAIKHGSSMVNHW